MKRITILSVAALMSLSTIAVAQPKDKKPAPKPAVRVLNITDGDDILADRPTGELVPINVRNDYKSSSLLRIRRDFIDLILKTAEEV